MSGDQPRHTIRGVGATQLTGKADKLTTTPVKTTTYTAAANQLIPADATGGAFTITLPAAAAAGVGAVVMVRKIDVSANAVTVTRAGSDTINESSTTSTVTLAREVRTYISDGTSKWTVGSAPKPLFVNVQDYGADPTLSAAANTAAIQAALNVGGIVWVPDGRYQHSTLTMNVNNTALRPSAGAVLVHDTYNVDAITVNGSGCSIVGGTLESPATWDGTNTAWTYAVVNVAGAGFSMTATHLKNIPKVGIGTRNVDNIRIADNWLEGNYPAGQWTGVETAHFAVAVDPGNSAIDGAVAIHGNLIQTSVQGVFPANYGAGVGRGISISGNSFYGCHNHGVYTLLTTGVSVVGNSFEKCQVPVAMQGDYHSITGNTMVATSGGGNTDTVGISLRDPHGCVVTGNTVYGSGAVGSSVVTLQISDGTTITDNIVSDNTIKIVGGTSYGIRVGLGSSETDVSRNTVSGNVVDAPGRQFVGSISVLSPAGAGKHNKVIDNIVRLSNSTYGIHLSNQAYPTVSRNTVISEYSAGSADTINQISLATVTYAKVEGNVLVNEAAYGTNVALRGVVESGSCANNSVINNTIAHDTTLLTSSTKTIQSSVGNGSVFSNAGATTLNVKDWGATAAGVVDDTAAINRAITAAGTTGTVSFPAGTYKITGTLTFACHVTASPDAILSYTGSGTAVIVGTATSGQVVQYRRGVLPQVVNAAKTALGWAQTNVVGTTGVKFSNLNRSIVDVPRISGFAVGLLLYGTGQGTAYVTTNVGHLDNNQINQMLDKDATGWANQNTFIGGSWSHNSNEGPNAVGTKQIYLKHSTGNGDPNNNAWFNPSLESATVVEYTLDIAGSYNQWFNPRFEFTGGHSKVIWQANAVRNMIFAGNDIDGLIETHVSGSTGNWILGTSQGRFLVSMQQGLVVEISGSSGYAAITITRAGGMTLLGDDPLTAYAWRFEANTIRGKRATDAYDRIVINPVNGLIQIGDGTAAPTIQWSQGASSPEGAVTAGIGSFYSQKDGLAGTTLWVKESGTGNTGWVSMRSVKRRVISTASTATPTPNVANIDTYDLTALAVAATFGAPTGSPTDDQSLLFRIKDDGTGRALTWNAIYRAVGTTLPTTTVATKMLYVACRYNAAATKWDVLAVCTE